MAKRPVMDVSELVGNSSQHSLSELVGQTPANAGSMVSDHFDNEEEEFENLYCRLPRNLFRKLRKRSWELSENRRKKVTVTQLVEIALRRYLEE
jgi:hypothetical protein